MNAPPEVWADSYNHHAMNRCILILLSIVFCYLTAFSQEVFRLKSPDGKTEVIIQVGDRCTYAIKYQDSTIVEPSKIALHLQDGRSLGVMAKVNKESRTTVQRRHKPIVQQKSKEIEEHFNELRLQFTNKFDLIFRAFNNGVAYRFKTRFSKPIVIAAEEFEIQLPANDTILFPEETSFYSHNERTYVPYAVQDLKMGQLGSLPTLISSFSGPKLLISESDLRNYPGLWIEGTRKKYLSGSQPAYPRTQAPDGDRDVRVPAREGYIATTEGSRTFPWRIIGIFEEDKDIISNQLTYLLSSPSEGDFSWIRPGKVAWDWYNFNNIYGVDFRAGVNTETYKYFIDFAAANGIEYIVLDEGWSKTDDLFQLAPEMDLEALSAYAKEKKVGIIFWVLWNALDRQLEPALDYFSQLGGAGIKVDFMQRDDQKMVNYYWRVAEAAAKRKLLVDFHGSYKPAGLHRTWPNVITREGVKGLEWSKWDFPKSISPEHNVTLPFIRMATGPMDYTPGAMLNAQADSWSPNFKVPSSLGTRCHQMAMYAIYESPLQMLADSPTNYEKEKECLDFIKKIPTVWEETVPLAGEVGDYVAIARQTADHDWYIGAMTDWSAREIDIDLYFLGEGKWTLEIFRDGINADRNAMDYKRVITKDLRSSSTITLRLAPGGGWVAKAFKE